MLASLFDPRDFHIGEGIVNLAAGGETPFLRSHEPVFHRYVKLKSSGLKGRVQLEEDADHTRHKMAQFVGVDKREIGYAASVADGVSFLVNDFDFKPGDRVLIAKGEFPSVAVPFATSRNAEVVEAERPDRASFAEALEAHPGKGDVRIIAVSYISYVNGGRADLDGLRQLSDELNAELWVDFTQAAGVMPLELGLCDFAFSSCYKWFLGTTGSAVCFWNSKRRPDWHPKPSGWSGLAINSPFSNTRDWSAPRGDAAIFARGNPAYLSLMVLDNALTYLEQFDPKVVGAHVQSLTVPLIEGLQKFGHVPTTPVRASLHGASVCMNHENPKRIVSRLAEAGILAWAGHGRVRFSFHGYNNSDDVEKTLLVMAKPH